MSNSFSQTAYQLTAKAKEAQQKTSQQTQQNAPATTRSLLNNIYTISKFNPDLANKYMEQLAYSRQDRTSSFYNPYTRATNQAIGNIAAFGIDTSKIDDDWFESNSWLKQYYQTTANTNGVKSPGKRASAEEKAAYQYNQIWMAEEQTKKAENEWNALQKELTYWAQRTDRNYSDEEIINKINWDNYKTLQKMDSTRLEGTPMELNRGIGYSEDAMYGVLWAARNGGSTGNLWLDMANSADGTGYKYNPEIASKLDPNSENFSPYSVGSTNIDDAAVYFGVSTFGKNWLQEHNGMQWSNDETEKKLYQKVLAAEENQSKAEEELAKLNAWVDKRLKTGTDPEKILSRINWSDYPTLAAMDNSIGKDGQPGTGDLVSLTRGLDYRYADLKQMIYDRCAENEAKGNGDQFGTAISNAVVVGITAGANAVNGKNADGMDAVSAASPIYQRTQQEMAVSKEQDKVLRNGAETVADIATPAEKAAMENVWSVTFDSVKNLFDGVKQSSLAAIQGLANSTKTKTMNDHASETLGNFQTIYNYEANQQNIEAMELELDALKTQLGDMIYAGREMESRKGKYITINGDQFYVTLNNVYTDDGSYMLDGASFMENGDPFNVDEETMTMLENSDEVKKYIEEANREAAGIEAISQLGETLPEETLYAAQRARELELSIEDAKEQNINHEAEYLESQKAFDDAQLKREETIHMLKALGCDTTDLEIEDSVIGYLVDFGNYEATVWNAYNPYAVYHIQLAEGEDNGNVLAQAKKDNDEVVSALEEATAVRDYLDRTGLTVPDNYRTNLDRHIAKLERDVKAYENFMVSQNDDFEKAAMDGRKLAYQSDLGRPTMQWEEFDPNTDYGMHEIGVALKEQMTDVEKNIYYYLLGKGDKTGAAEYLQSLTDMSYGVLHTRYTEYLKNKTAGMVKDDFFGTNVLAVLASPLASLASLGYLGYSVISGNEINPDNALLFLNNFKSTTREESAKQIINTFGEGTVGQKLVQGFYEIVTNRLDSLVNGTTFGVFSGGIGNDILQELVGASPMGLSAAMDAMMQAKRKGATDGQAYGIGLVTFLAETGTEAISLDNMKEAFGLGQEITKDGLKGFLKNWLTKAGISEMLGESANDIIENAADEWIMGDKSEHSDLVWSYRMKGYDKEDAEAMARMDELKGVLHTALISYLSPGLDIVSYGAGRMNYYRQRTRQAQQSGDNRNIIQIINGEKAEAQQRNADNREGQIDYDALEARYGQGENQTAAQEAVQTTAEAAPQEKNIVQPDETTGEQIEEAVPEQGPIEVINAPEEGAGTVAPETVEIKVPDLEADYQALEAAMEADQASQTATVASVLDAGGSEESSDIAKAAAANIDALTGGDMSNAEFVQDLVLGAYEGEVDGVLVKQAIQNAALSEDSAAYQVMQTSEYIHADLEQKAQMLAATVEADANNGDVMNQINKAVYEHQVATAEMELILNGGLNEAQKAQEAADAAAQETYSAQEELDARQADLEAKQDNLLTVNEEFQQDPADHAKADQVTRALNEVQKSSEVEQEYQQQLDNAKERQQKAEENAKRIKRNAMMAIRQQAEAVVADQNRQRQERQAQEEQIRQQKAEEEAQQKQAQEETDNAVNADAEAFIEQNYSDATDEEKQKIREAFAKIQAEAPLTRSMDDNGQMTPEAIQRRDKFVKQVAKKFGVQIDILDTTQGGKVDRQNGYVDLKNNRIVLDNTATMDDAMFFVLGHELTHIAEKSGTYNDLAGALLRMRYGTDDMRLAADIRARKALYDDRLARMHEQDSSIGATPLTEEQAAQEIVADIMGDLIRGDEELANRLVAEEPGIARRILDSIKSFIKKAVGMKGAWLSNAQKTVDMLESALTEATSGKQPSQRKFYLSESDAQAIQDQYPSSAVKVQTQHTPEQLQTVESYLGAVDNDVLEATMTYKDDPNAPFKRISVADVSDREAADLNRMFGIDVTGYRHDVDRNFFNHTEDRHGPNGKQDHTMADPNDVSRVGWVIENYDDLTWNGDVSYEYLDENGDPMPKIKYSKAVDGTIYVVEAVGENKWGKLHLLTAYMEKNNPTKYSLPDDTVTRMTDAELQSNVRNAYASPVKESVTQDAPGVKPLVTDDQGNDLATELPGGTVLVDPPTKYSLSSFNDKEQAEVRQALIRSGNFTPEQVDKYLDNALGLASMIAADKLRLDYTVTDPNKTMVKPNADYGASIDASTLCAKRLLYQGTFDAIQHALPNTPLMPEDLINLSNMMREMGYETPCGICYVESRRRNLGKYTEEWLKNYKGEYVPTVADVTTSDGLENLRKNHKQAYDDFMKAMNSHGNQNNPKPVQLRTDYRGEIRDLTDDAVQSAINHGGLRLQSFSDFETPHLLDMVQVVMDMASKGLTSQAYTKVPNFAWVFGDTGIKINLSLIGKGTGLDENGKLIFDDVEGMPISQAVALRDRYSKNVGTVLVGINDDHIKAAMADDRIDYIIPFHRSGWTKEDRKLMTVIADYKDYTLSQNEKDIKTGKKAEKNLEPVGEKTERGDGYWEFDKSGKENAEKYLELCKKNGIIPKFSQFLVDNGDGSYSLQPDGSTDGYWKLLIDFKMYDNDGNGSEQTAVTPNINMDQATRVLNDYSLERNGIKMESNDALPVAQPVVDRYVEEYKAQHPLDETRTKYSLPSQEVEEAAEKAFPNTKARTPDGKLMPLYHGTSADFTVFDTSISGGKNGTQEGYGIYLTDNAEIPKQYGGRTISAYVDIERPAYDDKKTFKRTELAKVIKAACEKEAQQFVDEGSYDNVKDAVRDTWISNYVYTPEYRTIDEAYKAVADMILDQNDSDSEIISELLIGQGIRDYGRAMDFYHNILTPLTGFDGIWAHWTNRNTGENSNVLLAFDSSQIKSNEPVTYDDNGDPIPMDQRFDKSNPDIRYSLPSDNLLEQQIRNYLSRGGILSTNTTPSTGNELGFPGQQPQRQFGSRTAQQSNALHDEVKDYLYNHSSYTPDSNQAQIDRAIDWVRSHSNQIDQQGYYSALDAVTADNFDYRSADGQARMMTVMSMAALKAENAETEAERRAALADELRLADAFNKQGTDLGRQLQARKIFRLMTPIGRQAALQRQADAINDDYARRGIETRVRLSDDVLQAAANAQTEEDFENVRKRANKELADQMPANWKDKLRGWRMLSMLGNPRTHIRNVVGNAMFIPAVGLKNKLGALGEMAFSKNDRTKTLSPILSKNIRDFARQDALAMKDELTGEAKYNEKTQIEQERKTFGKFLQAVSDFNSNALEAEDWFFLKGHYRRALGGWMQANGYTPEQLQHFPHLLEQGREYAIQEAQKATYRDFSKLASTLNQVSRGGGLTGFLVDATLPFKKTPANILKRGMEYSPAGIVKSLTADVYHLKQYNDYMNKLAKGDKKAVLPDKAISPSQFIDKLCSGLSGTAVMALGFLLANSGAVTVGLDDDEDKLEKEQGNQEYAIKANLFGNDVTFTMDWAAPMSMPFFVGAAIQNQMEKEGDFDVQSVLDAFGNITEPVFNLSMLDGVNSLFKTSQYDDTNTITQIGAKIASNYATSYVPSLMGAIARMVDDTRRKNFVEQGNGTGVLGTFRYAKEQVENKIPGLSQSNIPYRDVWGNAETSGLAERILENFILPGYISDYKNDPILNEMARLYEETGDSGMIPKDPDKSITVNKEKRVLTAEQWDAFKAARGQAAYNGLTDLMNSDDYKNASSTVQAQMVNGVWEYATQVGKNAVFPDYNMKDYGSNPVQTVSKDSKITSYKTEMVKALKAGDLYTYDTMVEALRSEDVDDTTIKKKIGDTFINEYKTAYLNGNYTRMAEIEAMLDDSGFDFDLESWEEQADKKRKP